MPMCHVFHNLSLDPSRLALKKLEFIPDSIFKCLTQQHCTLLWCSLVSESDTSTELGHKKLIVYCFWLLFGLLPKSRSITRDSGKTTRHREVANWQDEWRGARVRRQSSSLQTITLTPTASSKTRFVYRLLCKITHVNALM